MPVIRPLSSSWSLLIKRSFDLVAIVLSVPLWLPVVAVLAFLVRVKFGTPVFFRQKRAGRCEVIFDLVKFRTMTDARGADGQLRPDAERLTPFGRWLRGSSLDELPQLWNVLRGEMSLVGPRPLLVHYLPRYSAQQRRRHEVPPGLTGWAQVNGRNALSWEQKFNLDVWYVDHRGVMLDGQILWRTIWKVISRQGISSRGDATMPEFLPDQPTVLARSKSPSAEL